MLRQFLFVICLLSAVPITCVAQTTGGSISGHVTNSSGAAMPNVRIELENTATNQRVSVSTDSSGDFRISNLPVGHYRVITTSPASPATPAQEVDVELSRTNTLTISLPQGASTDSLALAESVTTSMNTASVARNYNTRFIHYLPQPNLVGKDGSAYGAYNLSLLTETTTSGAIGGVRGPTVAGQRPISNNYHLDGIDNNNKVMPGPLVYLSNEASTEFTLFQNQASPSFGHSTGGNFNTLVRSGTNQIHGSFYDYLQNRYLNAMDPGLRRLGFTDNPRYDQNRLGGSIGIPVIPGKFFFFGNLEWIPLGFAAPLSTPAFAPTAAGFATLSQTRGISATNLGIFQNSIGQVGPAVRNVVIGGVNVPFGRVNTLSRAWQNQFNGAGAGDWTATDKDALHIRYVHNELESNNALGGLSAFTNPLRSKSLLASVSHYHTFGVSVSNELRLGYNRYANTYDNQTQSAFPGLSAFPNIQISDVNLALGQPFGLARTSGFNTYHLADGVSARLGQHEFRIGFDGRRYLGQWSGYSAANGNYAYSTLERFLADLAPDVVSTRNIGSNAFNANQWLLFGYIQDHWMAAPGFAVDLGLRYEYATIPTGIAMQRFNSAASVPGVIDFSEPRSQSRNFAPHAGFAWSPGSKHWTVVRGGFGMAYDALYGGMYTGALAPNFLPGVLGNLQANTGGFLAGGGLRNPLLQGRATSTTFFPAQRLPYNLAWNVGVEQQIWRNFTAELKYIGNRGVHLPVMGIYGATPRVTPTQSLPLFYSQPSQAQLNALPLTLSQLQARPASSLAAYGFTNPLLTLQPDGASTYHAFTGSLHHRFTGGFQALLNYTWSHWIDDSTGSMLDLGAFGRERANSLYDRRHRASATGMFELAPLFGHSLGGFIAKALADFNISGTYTYESPMSITALSGTDAGLTGFATASRAIVNPNGTGMTSTAVTPLRNTGGQVVGYLANDPSARFIQGAPGLFASGGRGGLRFGEINNVDVAAVKRFNFADRVAFEARAEAYNLLNHTQFTGGSINNIGFRSISAVPSFLIPGTTDFGNLESAVPASQRMLQLALRVTF